MVALGYFGDDAVLVVDELVLVTEIGIHDPGFHSTGLHEVLHFAEDAFPVLLGGFLTVGFETDGVVGASHTLMLQN